MSFAQALVKAVNRSPYTTEVVESISVRKNRNNGLAAHVLFSGLTYPPKDFDSLLNFIQSVEASGTRASQRRAIYYLFLDFPPEMTDGEQLSEHFANETALSNVARSYVKGLWLIDHEKWEDGVVAFSEPWELEIDQSSSQAAFSWVVQALHGAQQHSLLCTIVDAKQPILRDAALSAYINSLCALQQFARALDVLKAQSVSTSILGKYVVQKECRASACALAQLACTPEEWAEIDSVLAPVAEANPEHLAGEVRFTRALHTGDMAVVKLMKKQYRWSLAASGIADY